jgi:flagellin
MRVLDSASALLSRLQELAVLGANDTNTTADHEAINLEAEAIGDEFNRLMTTSSYKGRDVFNTTAGSLYVSMGGRDQEMTFGIGKIDYTALYGGDVYGSTERTVSGGPNDTVKFHLKHLPSDAVAVKTYGAAAATGITTTAGLAAGKSYIITAVGGTDQDTRDPTDGTAKARSIQSGATRADGTTAIAKANGALVVGYDIKVGSAAIADVGDNTFKEVGTDNFVKGFTYEVVTAGASFTNTGTANSDAAAILAATSRTGGAIAVGDTFTVNDGATAAQLAALNSLTDGATFRVVGGSNLLTQDIEAIQGLVNTARVQAGSQYAAIESAVNYTTDLTAQYELGYNTVNDVNFSMETAHLAKNQILQQAATAMLAQANQGQQGLLQLIS